MDHIKGVNGHWETGVANKLDGTEDWRISGEALEVWKRLQMDLVRKEAIADVDARIISEELKSFADVHKVIKVAASPGEIRYGEELIGDFPGKGEHWATAADERQRLADLDDLANLPSLIAASPLGDELVQKAAARLHARIDDLKKAWATMGTVGLPSCRFAIQRRITDLERGKKVLGKCRGKDIHAHLSAMLRLDSLTLRNTRDAARKTHQAARNKKTEGQGRKSSC